MESLKHFTVEYIYVGLAFTGGMARYLNNYISGKPFSLSMLLASSIISAFSGLMFSLLGSALDMPINIQFMMAGLGGYFGDQTMKLLLEILKNKIT